MFIHFIDLIILIVLMKNSDRPGLFAPFDNKRPSIIVLKKHLVINPLCFGSSLVRLGMLQKILIMTDTKKPGNVLPQFENTMSHRYLAP